MTQADLIIILIGKVLVITLFPIAMFYWRNKTDKRTPIYVYWTVGFFIVMVISFTLFEWVLRTISPTLEPLSAILGIMYYILIGMQLQKKKVPTLIK
jgi:NADH:ubiquinone oxidoreductase subunit 6 (subunit J)